MLAPAAACSHQLRPPAEVSSARGLLTSRAFEPRSGQVFNLVLGQMLEPGGTASALSHTAKAALNGASALLKEVRTLAFKLEHAKSGAGQERLYLQAAVTAIRKLEPGATMLGASPSCIQPQPLRRLGCGLC